MKVLFLSHSPNNPNGGASRIYHILANGFAVRGHFVRTLHYEDFHPSGNPFIRKLIDRVALPYFMAFQSRQVWREEFDVIMSSSGMAWPIYRILRKKKRRPLLISHIHGFSIFDHLANMTEYILGRLKLSLLYRSVSAPTTFFWENQAGKYADLTIVQSDRDFDFACRSKVKPTKIKKIQPGVFEPILNASLETDDRERRANSLLWFGSWVPRKGIFAVPAAFELILDNVLDVTLTIGGVHQSEDAIRSYFSDRANLKIKILSKISVEQQISCFRQHSIFLFPSLSEGFGLALLEAMSCGLAAVTTDTGVGGDSLEHEKNALIVPKGSAIHLAQAAIRLLTDHKLRSLISRNGRSLAQTYTESRMVSAYEEAFVDGLQKAKGKLA